MDGVVDITVLKGETMNNNKKKILGIGLLLILIASLSFIYFKFSEKPVEGSKLITIEVINKSEESTKYELKTDAEYLRQAMEEADGLDFSGTEGDYGIMIDTVNGERADYNKDGAYWSFLVNGDYSNYGVDDQPVKDGDKFQIVYTKQ